MKIGIDLRVLSRGTRTGVEEYLVNLLAALLPLDQNINYHLFYNAFRKVEFNPSWLKLPNVWLGDFSIPNRVLFLSTKYQKRPQLDRLLNGVDIYFNPHFFNAPVSKDCQKVVVFHDLSFERYPEYFSWRKRIWQRLLIGAKSEARNADKVIAVSESTKSDLIHFYQIEPEKIKVIYSGVSDQFSSQQDPGKMEYIKEKYSLPDRFILYFGTIEPRKNLTGLIKAYELLRDRYPIKLVIAGNKGWLFNDIFKTAAQSKYQYEIIFTGFIEEQDKPYLYNLSELFVYPSFFEGFGFPPLEAMASGIPVVTSSSSSLPEVVGEAGLMVDPFRIDEMALAMETVLTNRALKKSLIEKGLIRARKFSWLKTAQETLNFLQQ